MVAPKYALTLLTYYLFFCVAVLKAHASDQLTANDMPNNTPSDVAEYIKMTLSDDILEQIIGAKRLGSLGKRATPAIPFLIRLASIHGTPEREDQVEVSKLYEQSNDFNPFLSGFSDTTTPHLEAALALRAIGEPAFGKLIEILENRNAPKDERSTATWVFIKCFKPSMKDLFIKIVSDKSEDLDVRIGLVYSLGARDGPILLNCYNDILKDESENEALRYAILFEFQDHKMKGLNDKLLNTIRIIFDDKRVEDRTRARAGEVLAIYADGATLAYLEKILEDSQGNSEIRKGIAEGVGMNPSRKAKQIVDTALSNGESGIRNEVILGMGQSRDPGFEDIIIRNADKGDTFSRICTVQSLYHFASAKTIEKLFSILRDQKGNDEYVLRNVAEFLARLDNAAVTDRLFEAQSFSDFAHHALLQHLRKDEHLLEKWIETLENGSLPVEYRRDAVIAIDVCNNASEKGPRALAKASSDEDIVIRQRISFVQSRIGTDDQIPVLEMLAKDKDKEVSHQARNAIQKIKEHTKSTQ